VESTTSATSGTSGNGAAAEDGASAESFEVLNPATGQTVRTIEVDAPDRVREVVARVRANQPAW